MSFKPPYGYMTAQSLSSILKASPSLPRRDIAIVDVRDDDFQGGNIVGCLNVPSNGFDAKVQGLVKDLKDVPTVIFHCSLSQQRGPKAARIYSEARQSALASNQVPPLDTSQEDGIEGQVGGKSKESESQSESESDQVAGGEQGGQKIFVLRDGFANFSQIYKKDAELVEKYDEEAWAYR